MSEWEGRHKRGMVGRGKEGGSLGTLHSGPPELGTRTDKMDECVRPQTISVMGLSSTPPVLACSPRNLLIGLQLYYADRGHILNCDLIRMT